MDPIKVDFTGGGDKSPDRKDQVVIPPERRGLKIALNIIATVVFGVILYYFMLPVFNVKSIMMYAFIGLILAFYCVANYVTSGALRTPDYSPYARKSSMIPKIAIGVVGLVVVVGFIVSSVFFRAHSYAKIIDVNSASFEQEIEKVDFKTVPTIDEETTGVIATKALSKLDELGYVSQFTIQPNYFQINFQDTPVRVVPIQYSNIIKWFTNAKNGLPGYVLVDTITQKAKFVDVDGNMKYSTADHFAHYVTRHVRFQYPTYLLDDPAFEVDETGHPYWIFAKLDMTIGLFGGRDVTGAIICDAVTGECAEYTIDEIRTKAELQWIDRVYNADLLVEQYNYYGRYQSGFWNSILGQKGTYSSTDGYSYLAMNNDVYMYTGVTSLTSDESITGFVLVNQRTKEAKYYNVSGTTETGAQGSAQELVQDLGYIASFPLLLNIDDVPTYFMPIKGDSKLVKGYAMVNVGQYSIAAYGSTISECIGKYADLLEKNNIKSNINVDTDAIKDAENAGDGETEDSAVTVTGAITEIRTAVIGGESVYYIKLDNEQFKNVYFSVKASSFENVVIANKGDNATVTIKTDAGKIIPASAFEVK
ncbi:MAG: CvpA family protein [Clostridia bacterium]|nr:CvpA family protein [Clostridia bacterium]